MTARDAGGIACRIFALYLGFVAFERLTSLLMALPAFGHPSQYRSPSVLVIGEIVMISFASILLWVKSLSLWPSDSPVGGSVITAQRWIKIFVLLFGIYLLTMSCTIPLMAIFKATLQTKIEWPDISGERLFIDIVRCLAGIGFIVYGSSGWNRVEAA